MGFGTPTSEELIFTKTKEWWNNLKKLHLPSERLRFSDRELQKLAKYQQQLKIEVRRLELSRKTPVDQMIDFRKLQKLFFREYKHSYGVPIVVSED